MNQSSLLEISTRLEKALTNWVEILPLKLIFVISYILDICWDFLTSQLQEITIHGEKSKANVSNIFKKLDRILITPSILNVYPNIMAKHHPFTLSDHCLIKFNLGNDMEKIRPPFRFEMAWTNRPDYSNTVQKVWSYKFHDSYMFKLLMKLKLLKKN